MGSDLGGDNFIFIKIPGRNRRGKQFAFIVCAVCYQSTLHTPYAKDTMLRICKYYTIPYSWLHFIKAATKM